MNSLRSIGVWQFVVVLVFLIISGVNPHDRFTWLLEVSWVGAGLILVVHLSRKGITPTTLLAWLLMLHAIILIYGGWHTYERVPLGNWMKEAFGFERNHYDRIGHFAQGFIPAVLIREVLVRQKVVNGGGWLEFVVFAGCMAFTSIFEIIEFGAAVFLVVPPMRTLVHREMSGTPNGTCCSAAWASSSRSCCSDACISASSRR